MMSSCSRGSDPPEDSESPVRLWLCAQVYRVAEAPIRLRILKAWLRDRDDGDDISSRGSDPPEDSERRCDGAHSVRWSESSRGSDPPEDSESFC